MSEPIICTFASVWQVYMIKRYIFFLSALLIAGCGNLSGGSGYHPEAKGGRAYGGTLKVNETDPYVTLFPHTISDVISHHIAGQIYDGLVRIDPKNITRILPCIAEKWELNADGTVYTFHLRKGVLFHNDDCFPEGKGREVMASDFKYSFELLCSVSEENQLFEFQNLVKGAKEYYEASKKGKPDFEM